MRLLVLPGDGIGPEITSAAMRVLTALNAPTPSASASSTT